MDTPEKELTSQIIDASQWLRQRVGARIKAQRFKEAIADLSLLYTSSTDEDERRQYEINLGYLYLLDGDLVEAERWLSRAEEVARDDPHLSYALGLVSLGHGEVPLGILRLLEAFVEARSPDDEAEFLRSAALAVMEFFGPGVGPASMLLGALDRDVGNPWILDALARVYAADERWLESLEALATLADVVRDAARSMVVYRPPTWQGLLRDRLLGDLARQEELSKRAREINQALRGQFQVVLDARQVQGPTGLAPLKMEPALALLVRIFERRDRGIALIEQAQNIWARASYEKFAESLGPRRMAGAIYLLVERLQWRVATPARVVAEIFDEEPEAIVASARLIAGRLELELFDEGRFKRALPPRFHERFEALHRALLFGERLGQARQQSVRLG